LQFERESLDNLRALLVGKEPTLGALEFPAMLVVMLAVVAVLCVVLSLVVVPAEWQRTVLAIAAACALGAALLPIYASTAVRDGTPTNLLGIFRLR
jgi:hypothetical protein